MGTVKEVDVKEDNVGWGRKIKVKVNMDLTKPFARGRKITLMGEKL